MLILKKKKKRKQKMSKGQKKKVIVKLHPGEAVFVASVDILDHIKTTYLYMASATDDKEEKQSWINVADQVQEWIGKTYFSGENDYEEEW